MCCSSISCRCPVTKCRAKAALGQPAAFAAFHPAAAGCRAQPLWPEYRQRNRSDGWRLSIPGGKVRDRFTYSLRRPRGRAPLPVGRKDSPMRTTTFFLPLGFPVAGAGAAFLLPDVASRARSGSAEPQIRRVVVYPDRALVSRVAKGVLRRARIPVHFRRCRRRLDASRCARDQPGRSRACAPKCNRARPYAKAVAEIDEQLRILAAKHIYRLDRTQSLAMTPNPALAGRYEAVAQTMISRELGELPGPAGKTSRGVEQRAGPPCRAGSRVAAARAERRKLQRELAAEAADLQQQRSLRQQAAARRELFADVLVTLSRWAANHR